MFDSETQIQTWRAELVRAGLDNPEGLRKLENHLREDVEQQMRAATGAQQACASAVRRIGQAKALRREFAKVKGTGEMQVWKLFGIACSTFAGCFSLMIAPKIFGHHEASAAERMLGLTAVLFTFLSIPAWRLTSLPTQMRPTILRQVIKIRPPWPQGGATFQRFSALAMNTFSQAESMF
jgi:hypothetical protein